jgi:hypothetical protein
MPKPGWGAGIRGEATDLEDWAFSLKEPFDPWVEKYGSETVLRSASFDELTSADEVRDRAAELIERLNGALALSANSKQLRFGSVIQISLDGKLHRKMYIEPVTFEARGKLGAAAMLIGPDGKLKPEIPPQPSDVQRWSAVAENDELLDDALIYYGRATNWFDVYKTLECLIQRFGPGEREFLAFGWASDTEISRLKRSANAARHAKRSFEPPKNPMTLKEARILLEELMRRAFEQAEKSTCFL